MLDRVQRVFGFCLEIGNVVYRFSECIRIITDNPMLSKEEVDELFFLSDLLKDQIHWKRKEFYEYFTV